MQKIWRITLSRRNFLMALGVGFFYPQHIAAQTPNCRVKCGSACARIPSPISIIISLTGPAAAIGYEQRKGAQLAIQEIIEAGGKLSLLFGDSESFPHRAYATALRSIERDNSKVVICQMGSQLILNLASRYPNLLFINLGRETRIDSPPRNLFLLPLDLFKNLGTGNRTEPGDRCPGSIYAWQTYTALQMLEAAVAITSSGNISNIINSFHNERLKTSGGTFYSSSGVFRRQ